ncbi:MAG TPA: hypothetical protein VGI82_06425 [Chitinophagaceae bacterium]|jgi:hypothetical protein
MTRIVCVFITLILGLSGFSQVNLSPNVLSTPFQGDKFKVKTDFDVEGSPLVFDDWKPGEVTLTTGEVFHVDKVNFDGSTSAFIYSKKDTTYQFQDNVRQVRIFNSAYDTASAMVFRNDMLPQQSGFVQVLTKGKITILRKISKSPEGENYSNGIVNNSRKYVLHNEDVAVVDGKVVPFKYNSSDLEELTSDKKTQVVSYVKSNNLKPKKEDDFLKSINFYNSIN